ncbi:hypothetical protein GQ457_16G030360 [Hibiscus cannabinus]
MANFLWDGSLERKKIHWVKWSDVCLPKSLGGLGIIDLEVQNRALLGKWIWKFANDKEGHWQNIIAKKYQYNLKSLLPHSQQNGRLSWIWNGIIKSFEKDDQFGICIRSNLKIQLGDGSLINFWHDIWLCDVPLRIKFPRIFAICTNKTGVIADFGRKEAGGWVWNIPLRRPLFDREIEIWNCFLRLLHGRRSSSFDHDWISWEGSSDGIFSVKALVHKFNFSMPPCGDRKLLVWRGVAPPKVEVFTWLVIRQRIPVRAELVSRGLTTIIDHSCNTWNLTY